MPYPPVDNGRTFIKTTHKDTYPFINPAKSDHTGHYVLITGGSKGIGLATAISFAQAGAAGIAITGRSDLTDAGKQIFVAAAKAGKPSPKIVALPMDVLDLESVNNAMADLEKVFPKLDILINNAGYLSPFDPIMQSEPADWWKNWEVNVRGVYWVTKAILPFLLNGGEKTIVNVSSAGAHGVRHGGSGYQTTKFALLRFTEYLMVEHFDDGLLAYSVHPCGNVTKLGSSMPKDLHHLLTDTLEIASDTMCFLTQTRREWLAGRYVSCTWDMEEFLSREQEIVEGDKLKMRMTF
ncbi:NAD-P-binding protein [Microthyrium microscopicum]|uniref:NAD-P-binding protein n=1 Tax=Microthyrium microscopicum TaxID=703497 RepID=A0A6A6UEK2_9PEZI|nr:NAD-P-binding protein [Microthyrium microscopicum]